MNQILVPIDFSDVSIQALNYACYLAKSHNAKMILLHVMNPPLISTHADKAVSAPDFEQERQAALERLLDLQSKCKEDGLDSDARVEVGFVADVIHQIELEQPFLYIVMGTTGASGFVNSLIGSNASAVMNKVITPLLMVPHESSQPNFKSITFCTAFQTDETDVLKKVIAFAHKFGSFVTLLKVNAEWTLEVFSDEEQIRHIRKAFPDENMNVDIFKSDNVLQGIDEYIEAHQPGLLMLAIKRKSLIERLLDGSVSRRIALHTRVPLLVYHH